MVHRLWPHIGKNLKADASRKNRTARRSGDIEYIEEVVIDNYEDNVRHYMSHVDKRKSNRRNITEKKNLRNQQRSIKYGTI
jgi:hypothetical protein